MPRHYRLLIGLGTGILLGAVLHPYSQWVWLNQINQNLLNPIGQIFLRLIFVTVVPLVFSALVLGVFELGQGHGLGRIAGLTLFYTVLASAISVLVGIVLVNGLKPGAGYPINPALLQSQSNSIAVIQKNATETKNVAQAIVELIPSNPVETATKALGGEMLPFMVFSVLFGLALIHIIRCRPEENHLVKLLEQLFSLSMKMVDFALMIAPIGVFAIIFNTVFRFGTDILFSLFYYIGVVVLGLLVQQFVVYSLLLKGFSRQSPLRFFQNCRDVYLYAFSTASSNATLPLSLETAENRLRLPPRIARFVLTVGATANQNGTALFEGVTVLFLAQVYGIHLSMIQQIQVVLMSILAGIGTAGVPGGSLPLVMILLQQVGIPPEGIGLILGADRFLDMCRTTLNVSGDLVITALVSESHAEN